MTDTLGNVTGNMTYEAYGKTASGDVATDKKFTGQRLDETGLYFYNARYYDAVIGRFISPDILVARPWNPQSFNRYSYCLNNPLKYADPSGLDVTIAGINVEDPSCLDASIIAQMSPEQRNEFLAALQAWLDARENSPYDTQRLMDSSTTYTVQFGDIDHNLGSVYNPTTQTLTISNDYLGCDSWWTGRSLLPAIQDAAETAFFPVGFHIPKGVWIAAGIILFIGGTMLTAGGGTAALVCILGAEVTSQATAGTVALLITPIGLVWIDSGLNLLQDEREFTMSEGVN
ncbi:MAG: RHS repeat-associated core domain-containing protein [Dehalococcoidia bacterium]|nr:RHS repeat-associated core domain-containing protein [Dehalococcoidia bacterium]